MRRSRGFTLVELLLVLAILVVVAAMAAPALRGVMRDQELRSAADQVRIEWTRAHVKAMKTGRIQVFRYELGGQKFSVQPWAAADDALESAQPQVAGFGLEPAATSPAIDEENALLLPEGTMFVAGDAKAESRSLSIEEAVMAASQYQSEWSRPIMFYPDGSTSDAFLVVANEREVGIRVNLRGMTGTATISDINSLEELVQ